MDESLIFGWQDLLQASLMLLLKINVMLKTRLEDWMVKQFADVLFVLKCRMARLNLSLGIKDREEDHAPIPVLEAVAVHAADPAIVLAVVNVMIDHVLVVVLVIAVHVVKETPEALVIDLIVEKEEEDQDLTRTAVLVDLEVVKHIHCMDRNTFSLTHTPLIF